MKKIILIGIIIIIKIIIPPYQELNNIIIVDKIEINCNKIIKIKIKEIIPIKKDNTIKYEYKYYQKEGNNIKEILKQIEIEEKKKIYLNHHKITCN